ncbi:AlwI family type II restriction endonuclease [Acinetobacter baumannii]|uniref:AlwI family type II restriction endonuclease n=3 Tax=Acinetobacter baumannii TaxID=470 RepID=A0AAQ0WH33_ACIBA|nr:AlwI family type II restriction endonuclease [Acinetobacter baumannii]EHU1922617.1 AlwI family type II restriction endonuclease [Acinetobacter baumannii]EHU1987707.1 AlwI family type II restriction endonuclease [Acinetobacter baumannii]EHU2637216.1 AlwI family type II restriction endonuclease [Acinetobacter baumannii]EHU3101986.1 AlwI family type II restriction endonuclease [Acinetobacter baumannii]EHU3109157.1 AlwI family type II restriction endonuclease [Acinetobacter baumannii]
MSIWHFGNTTVRSALRLIDGLKIFVTTHGNIIGKENEIAFCKALANGGVINANFNSDNESGFSDTTYSVGRKWRSALEKLGFIEQQDQIYILTENGKSLLYSKSLQSSQECYLRSLILYSIKSEGDCATTFSPLMLTISIMKELENRSGTSKISFQEMAVVIQLTFNYSEISRAVNEILCIRDLRKSAKSKKKFDQELYQSKIAKAGVKVSTIKDYADTNLRYLKSTGLFTAAGKGICFIDDKKIIIDKLIEKYQFIDVEKSNFDIKKGAPLPTDDIETNFLLIRQLEKNLKQQRITFSPKKLTSETSISEIKNFRYHLEELLFENNEKKFAENQKNEWNEILGYMQLLISSRPSSLDIEDKEIFIPSGEKPAYFEWVIWRAFLALNHLVIEPQQCRRFKVDQDFRPIHNAPGGGSDVIFEYEDFKILGEVTLTSNSRQEAAEGEPVRRHIAMETVNTPKKQVYGLFIAINIDTNTAETFRHGAWYHREELMDVKIIPLTLQSFKTYLETLIARKGVEEGIFTLKEMMDEILALRENLTAPQWKNEITSQFSRIL